MMNRKDFLKESSYSLLSIAAFLNIECQSKNKKEISLKENGEANFPLMEATIDELQEKMQSGIYTSHALTKMYLERIQAMDKHGPVLNSIIELNPDALSIADSMDNERRAGRLRGPLHGIPVLIKDNIDTADKMMTTAGALAMEGNKASADAFIVRQLRKAGAVLLGKTNLSEWANFRSERSVSGWSSRGGQTRNPYVLDRNPCGSSSGSGVAVSANLCALAIGTETNGSIACPSSINGIVGIKPTVGLWSRSGIIPISATHDTAGPMARTVKDAATLLGMLAGVDENDPATLASKGKSQVDYTPFLKLDSLKGKRIGVEKSFLKGHEQVDALLAKALAQMKQAGAEIIEVDLISKIKTTSDAAYDVLKFEFKDGLNRYLATAHANVKSLEDVIRFNKENESRAMPFFKQEILEASQALPGLDDKKYQESIHTLLTTTRGVIDKLFEKYSLDTICGPANGPSWCTDPVNGDFFTGYGMYSPAAVAGYPSITLPMGMVFELPVGLSFIGKPFGEAGILAIAFAYEQLSKNRVPPKFFKTFNSL